MQTSELPSSRFYEELFCTSQTTGPLVPLASALITSAGPQSDVVKQGYLGKLERNHRRYFVLRAGSHTGPSRLEWYKNQEKFTAMEKSSGKAVLFWSSKQGRTGSSRKGHTVAVYAKDQTMVLVVEDQQEQEDWYLAIKKLMEEEQKDEEHGEGLDEEDDDGYCTLPLAAFFKEVWPVSVKPRGLGRSKSLTGETRLCLTATSLILVKVGTCSDLPSVTIPLLSVRRFGHLDGSFFLELGRSAPDGPGEIWMEARDQGNQGIAQQIHEVVRETVRALRALPDFSRSPTSNHNKPQALLISKRSRPKHRDKLINVGPRSSLLAPNTDVHTSPKCYLEPRKPDETEPESTLSLTSHLSPLRSQQSSVPETGSYMEMKMEHCRGATCRMESLELGEEEEEEEKALGYMMMSPQVSDSSPALPMDDYVTMTSPCKHQGPPFSSPSPSSSLQTSFNSFTSDSYSPVHPSHHQTNEHIYTRPLDDAELEQKSVQDRRHLAQRVATSSPVGSVNVSDLMPPFFTSGAGYTKPVQASPNSGTGRSTRLLAVPDQSAARRYRLSSCLLSCLQAKDGS
ncbi:insulin receptor substrate 1-like [Seriola lalandi dorsalis]|uniref:insulin receptor substrate 1-like n=1 Tax=Seriola lalandi dorsalis TaxID=1841481 RepID=UPI000C6F4C21|nr:insulin receptor substrate 1-like [Seriola lalandi dorsalis]